MEKDNTGSETKKEEFYPHSKVIGTLPGKDILASSHPKEKKIGVKLYDFKRPDKFSREHIKTLQIIHESFSRLSTTNLSAVLRYICEVTIEIIDQMTFGEYMLEIPNPSTIGVINIDPYAD